MFKRHNGRRSETDLRLRQSLETTRNHAYARSSEQIARRPSSSHPEVPQIVTTIPENYAVKSNPRFSLMRFRHASDSAIGQKARDPNPPPIPTSDSLTLTPSIITTAPANEDFQSPGPPRRTSTMRLWRRVSADKPSTSPAALSSEGSSQRSSFSKAKRREGNSQANSSMRTSRVTFDEPERPRSNPTGSPLHEPPAYDDQISSLPLPPPRLSESSRSTASSSDHYITTTTTQTTTTTTTFFRLPRRKRKETSLFPLPLKVEHGRQQRPSVSDTDLTPPGRPRSMTVGDVSPTKNCHDQRFASQMLAATGLGLAGPGGPGVPILRSNSTNSARSAQSSPTSLTPTGLTRRDRSSTMSSLDRTEGRGSIGRRSFSGMFGRIRRDSEPIFGGPISRNASPQPYSSGPTSLAQSQEIVTIPERNDSDTPQMYLSKLFEALSKSVVASLLARNGDLFHLAVLKAYMGTFEFASTPMDMALR